MSQSLVRRGIDLYKDDLKSVEKGGKIKCIKSAKLDEADITKLVGTNKKGYKRKLKRLQQKQTAATLKEKKLKSTDSLYDIYTKKDNTDDNIKALNFMRLLNTDEKKTMDQAAHRHNEKSLKKRNNKKKDKSETKEPTSIFSEKDFEDFFKEYNFS